MIAAVGRRAPLVLLAILQTISQPPAQDIDPLDEWTVKRVVRWLPLVERWSPDYPELEHALVLAVMAAESAGDPYVRSYANCVGLMQVLPRSWTASESQLWKPHINVYWGMRILHFAIRNADGDLRLGLAYYNCSEESVHADKCGDKGGLHYADRILYHWLPMIRWAIGQEPEPEQSNSETLRWSEGWSEWLKMLLECIR